MKYKRNFMKTLWYNRPSRFIPDFLYLVKRHPYTIHNVIDKNSSFFV